MMVWRQYKKELAAHRTDVALIVGALIVWYVFLATRVDTGAGGWPYQAIITLSALPVGFLPIWILWTSLQLYRQEWRENTHYLMLSIPAPMWKITGAKLAVLMTGVVGYALLIAGGVWAMAIRTGLWRELTGAVTELNLPIGVIVGTAAKLAVLFLAGSMFTGLAVQLAFVVSRLFTRFQGLVIAWAWLLQIWIVDRGTDLLAPLLNWMPPVAFRGFQLAAEEGGVEVVAMIVDSGPFWALVLIGIGGFALLNATLSRAVEV